MISDTRLASLLWWAGAGTLTAFAAAMLPAAWLSDIAAWLGIEFPVQPVVVYLARHLSLLYGMVGVLFLWIAGDLPRYRPLLPKLGAAAIAFGVAQAIVGWTASMPHLYTAVESVSTILGGTGLWILTRPGTSNENAAAS